MLVSQPLSHLKKYVNAALTAFSSELASETQLGRVVALDRKMEQSGSMARPAIRVWTEEAQMASAPESELESQPETVQKLPLALRRSKK